jgi:hypothetical protein
VGEGVDGSQDKGVDKGHGLLVTAWGQAEKNAWGEHKGEDGKEEGPVGEDGRSPQEWEQAVAAAAAVKLILDHVQQAAMQAFDQREGFQIGRTHGTDAFGALPGRFRLAEHVHRLDPVVSSSVSRE